MKNISRFTIRYKEGPELVVCASPVGEKFNIVCDICNCSLYQEYYLGRANIRFYDIPAADQLDKLFVSQTVDGESIQYCSTCAEIIEIAPL